MTRTIHRVALFRETPARRSSCRVGRTSWSVAALVAWAVTMPGQMPLSVDRWLTSGSSLPLAAAGWERDGQDTTSVGCIRLELNDRGKPAPNRMTNAASWSLRELASVRNSMVCPGMTAEMIRAAWGLPQSVLHTYAPTGKRSEYTYPRHRVHLVQNHVVRIQTLAVDGRPAPAPAIGDSATVRVRARDRGIM